MAEDDEQHTTDDHRAAAEKRTHDSTSSRKDSDSPSPPKDASSKKRRKDSNASQSDNEDGEVSEEFTEPIQQSADTTQAPLPDEPTPPPLPDEPPPPLQDPQDDGWEPVWDETHQAFYFYNRFTQLTQWENPRVPSATQPTNHDRMPAPNRPAAGNASNTAEQEVHPAVVGGYNPAIHGSYDPNAPYAQYAAPTEDTSGGTLDGIPPGVDPADYTAEGQFNRFTGRFQNTALQPSNFSDENKTRRQMNAFFDVDAAANSHDGRSLRAERAGRKLTKDEVKQFRERRRERKEEKRRAWLRD